MVDIGNRLNRDTRAVLSNMDEPLGLAVGNALEVKEAVAALKGNGPRDLMELCFTTGAIMLVQAKCADSFEEADKMLHQAIENGAAFEKFCQMVEAQGGDVSYIRHPEKFEVAKNLIEIRSKEEGYVKTLDALDIGVASMKLGGGRETLEDKIDMSAGIILNKKVGDYVKKGELLCTLHTNKNEKEYSPIMDDVLNAFVITKEEVKPHSVILEIIDR
jgi:pyrimidine-nucleoside phosphorylase